MCDARKLYHAEVRGASKLTEAKVSPNTT